jgi:hypothetical protein
LPIKVEALKLLSFYLIPKNDFREIARFSQFPGSLFKLWVEWQPEVIFTCSLYHPVISRWLMTPLRGRGISLACSRWLFMLLFTFHETKIITNKNDV